MNRTRVPRWNPPPLQALRLAWRPALAYFIFTMGGMAALFGANLWYKGEDHPLTLFLAVTAGMGGLVMGLVVSIFRARTLPVVIIGSICVTIATILLFMAHPPFGEEIMVTIIFFCFAFPCGMLAMQHRWELFASFFPAVGWIGGVFVIINHEHGLSKWHEDKVSVWMPVPLFFLACFLALWLFYLSSKQAMRVELWQSLSGAVARRISKKAAVGAIPRRNVLPMLFAAAILFGVVALLSPYLWRTGKGDKPGDHDGKPKTGEVDRGNSGDEPDPKQGDPKGPKMDGEAIVQQMKELASAAKNTAVNLWPLLLLLLLYRPAKRALLNTHLLTPVVPTPPTERIDNNWEYVRIAAEDAGVVPAPSDSVEQLLVRIRAKGLGGPALARAAEIYARTRYGFTVGRGDPIAMRKHAVDAGRELRANLGAWDFVKNQWRRLS